MHQRLDLGATSPVSLPPQAPGLFPITRQMWDICQPRRVMLPKLSSNKEPILGMTSSMCTFSATPTGKCTYEAHQVVAIDNTTLLIWIAIECQAYISKLKPLIWFLVPKGDYPQSISFPFEQDISKSLLRVSCISQMKEITDLKSMPLTSQSAKLGPTLLFHSTRRKCRSGFQWRMFAPWRLWPFTQVIVTKSCNLIVLETSVFSSWISNQEQALNKHISNK